MNRRTSAIIASTTLALLAAACSGRPAPAGGAAAVGGSSTTGSAVAYSHCIRAHGLPNYPDPPGDGQVPKADAQELGVSSTQLQTAQRDCQHLYPADGGALGASLRQCEETGYCPQAMVQPVLNAMRRFSRCMRAHGVPDWPDPTVDAENRPGFNLVPIHGTDWNGSFVQNKIYGCERLMPAGGGVPAIYPGQPG